MDYATGPSQERARAEETPTGGSSGPSERGAAGGSTSAKRLEEDAFRAFYDRHVGDVLHFLRFQVKDEDRPDVASRTFEIAARDLPKFVVPPGRERTRAERAWLFTIARNAAANFRQRSRQAEEIDEETMEAPGDLERDAAAFELAVALLWTLPERLRTMYLLHERDGLTHEELAEQLDLPLGTVKTQLRAAQADLDAKIERMCARERTRRGDYLRAVPLPFVAIGGLIEALRNVEEDVDADVAEQIREGMRSGAPPTASAPATSAPAASPGAASPGAPTPGAPTPSAASPTVGATSGGASVTARAVGGLAGAKLAVALIGAGVGGAAIAFFARPSVPVPAPPVAQVEVVPARTVDTAPTSAVVAAETSGSRAVVVAATSAPSVAPSGTNNAPADGFRTEGDVMQAARNAFASGDYGRAIKLSDQHGKRYPGGSFVAEREAIAIRALAQVGRTAEARARADVFRRVFPRSVFRGAVDAATGVSSP